jgi:Family of unknown function (DUF6365)
MTGRKHLFLALDAAAWGRVALGLDIAHELQREGDRVLFVAHTTTAPLVRTSSFPLEELTEHLGPLSQLCVESYVEAEAPQSIVLCDFHSCTRYFELRGVDPTFVTRQNVPVIAMDIWNCHETGLQMDLVGGESVPRADRIEQFRGRIVPVPIGRPNTPGAYCGLSSPVLLARSVCRHIRQNLGLTDANRAVLFCTAGWQHGLQDSDFHRLATAVPQLLWTYLAQVDPRVRLVHIGPVPLPLEAAGDRYLWMPAVTPNNFDRLLGSVDLFLSANISATTVGRAITSGVPVVVVENSCRAETVADAEAVLGGALSPALRAWFESAAPLYPFSLWPLGYWQFLRPLLRDNPYCSAIDVLELMDEAGFVETCRQLLFNAQAREAAVARQARYVAQVRQLPTAAQLIDTYLN